MKIPPCQGCWPTSFEATVTDLNGKMLGSQLSDDAETAPLTDQYFSVFNGTSFSFVLRLRFGNGLNKKGCILYACQSSQNHYNKCKQKT